MTIDLDAELERLVQEDLATGAFSSVEEFVRRAVTELHERVRQSHCDCLPQPTGDGWEWLRKLHAEGVRFDDDMVAAVEEDVPQQERPELDQLFA